MTGKVPPPPYPDADAKGYGHVTIGKTKYPILVGDGTHVNPKIPVGAVDKMAHWSIAAKKADNDLYSDLPTGKDNAWLGGDHSGDTKYGVVWSYAQVIKPAPTVGTLPGEGTATNAVSSSLDFLNKVWAILSDGNTWLRVLEVGIGVVLLAVGVAHLSGHANPIAKHAGVKL